MKVQVSIILNVDIDRSQYVHVEGETDEGVMENLRDEIDSGELSMDDLMEQSTDYTVLVLKGQE